MDAYEIKGNMQQIFRLKNWKTFVDMIEEGYKGIFVILRIVRDNPNVCSGDLARETGVSTARIARALNTLEEKGYVERIGEKNDGRKVLIKLTSSGEKALEERESHIVKTLKKAFDNLTEEEIIHFFELLKKLLG